MENSSTEPVAVAHQAALALAEEPVPEETTEGVFLVGLNATILVKRVCVQATVVIACARPPADSTVEPYVDEKYYTQDYDAVVEVLREEDERMSLKVG